MVRIFTDLISEGTDEKVNKIALKDKNDHKTYGQLFLDINKIAFKINSVVKYPQKIGVFLPRSIQQIETMLGIFQSGNTYVPLDIKMSLERLNFIIHDSGCQYIISNEELYNELPSTVRGNVKLIDIDALDKTTELNNMDSTDFSINADNDAYIIYTSGTTGRPKGVRISYSNLINLIKHTKEYFNDSESANSILMNSLSFDFCIWETFISLLTQGCLHLLEDNVRIDQKKLIEYIASEKITAFCITPSYFSSILNTMELFNLNLPIHFERIVLGAEKITPSLLKRTYKVLGEKVEIYNAYGPTECTVCSFIKRFNPKDLSKYEELGNVPIGMPFQDLKPKVLDDSGNASNTGMLYLSGESVSVSGYLNRPDETKKAFSKDDNQNTYITGDIVSIIDGEYYFLRRNDGQVKINGFRVELDEIKNVILSNDYVRDAVVIAYNDDKKTMPILLAFFVRSKDFKFEKDQLRTWCEKYLNSYMIPNQFIELDEIPRNLNGKTDEKALEEIFAAKLDISANDIVENDEDIKSKDAFKNVVAVVLGLSSVNFKSSFFEMGGRSLTAIQLQDQIVKNFKKNISIQQIFEAKSLEEIYLMIFPEDKKVEIKKESDSKVYPASPFQSQMWTVQMMEPKSNMYNTYFAFNVDNLLDAKRLENAVEKTHHENDVLQVGFFEKDAKVFAKRKYFNIKFRYVIDNYSSSDEILFELKRESAKSFDFENEILYEVWLYHLKDSKSIVYFKFHHILIDEEGFRNYYHQVLKHYFDPSYTSNQNNYYDLEFYNRQYLPEKLINWSKKLSHKNLTIKWKEIGDGQKNSEHLREFGLKDDEFKRLINFSFEKNMPLFPVILSALGLTLFSNSENNSFLVGVPMSNRFDINSISNVGPFMNTVPIMVNGDETLTVKEFLANTIKEYYFSLENRDVPLQDIINSIPHLNRSMTSSLFNVSLSEVNSDFSEIHNGIKFSMIPLLPTKPKFDLCLYFEVSRDSIKFIYDYNPNLFSLEDMDSMVLGFIDNLNLLMSATDELVGTIYNEAAGVISDDDKHGIEIPEKNGDKIIDDITSVLKEVLQVEEIKEDDDFFELGGDSIRAINLTSKLKKMGYQVLTADIFDNSNIKDYIDELCKKNRNEVFIVTNKEPDIPSRRVKAEMNRYPLSEAQEGMLWECIKLGNKKGLYHQQFFLDLGFVPDSQRMKMVLEELIKKIPVLRNRVFFDDDQNPVQEAASYNHPYFKSYENVEVQKILDEDLDRRFVLEEGHLIRFYLTVDKKLEKATFIITYHHLLLDGWSISFIIEEIFKNYYNLSNGQAMDIEHNDKFRNIIQNSNKNISSEGLEYWKSQVELIKPVEKSKDIEYSGNTRLESIFLSQAEMDNIIKYARDKRVTVNSVFLASYFMMLRLTSKIDDITIGVTISGRQDLDEEDLNAVGCLINTLPVHLDFKDIESSEELIKSCHRLIFCLNKYGNISLKQVTNLFDRKKLYSNELFNNIFVFQNYPIQEEIFSKYGIDQINSYAGINFDKTFIVSIVNEVELSFMYNDNNTKNEMEALLNKIKWCLMSLIENKDINSLIESNNDQSSVKDELNLKDIWEEVLGQEDISDEDNFFDLGGDSISSLRITLKLKEKGIEIPPDSLFKYQTIKELRELIEDSEREESIYADGERV